VKGVRSFVAQRTGRDAVDGPMPFDWWVAGIQFFVIAGVGLAAILVRPGDDPAMAVLGGLLCVAASAWGFIFIAQTARASASGDPPSPNPEDRLS
jgi:hypothetical protein